MEVCRICGHIAEGHPTVPPGPPTPPPERFDGVWRPPHNFTPSGLTVPELLDERDAQIKLWRARAVKAERLVDDALALLQRAERDARV